MPNELKRHLSWLDAASIVVGIVIGAGIFVTPQELARVLPSSNAMIMAWLLSGTLVFCGALAFAELSAMLPATGGLYIYLREAFGPATAFSSGWVHLFALFSGATAYVASGFARYLNAIVPFDPALNTPITVALILGIGALGAVSTKAAVALQNVTNIAKIAALLGLIVLSFFAPPPAASPVVDVPMGAFAAALATCFFCYEGWSYAGFVAGEMRNPARDLPRAFAVSFLVVVALYLMVNFAYLRVLSIPELQSSGQIGADVAGRVVGKAGATAIALVILLAIVGTVNGLALTASRMYYAQSKDGLFLPGLDKIDDRFQTPARSMAAHAIVSSLMVLFSSSLGTILQLAISAAWIYYAIAVAGLIRLRGKRPDLERPYRMLGYPVTPVLFLGGTLFFLWSLASQSPMPVLWVFAIMAVSFPIHAFIGKSKRA
jgi:basic amino acid/polyamine antiporter, APA family